MRQLIYSSRWSDIARRDIDLTLQQIIAKSIQNNRLVDITGCLLTRDDLFIQLLEGPSRGIADTFKRIAADERHRDIAVIADTSTDRRLFQQWSMAFAKQTQTIAGALDGEGAKGMLLAAHEQQLAQERQQLLG